MKILYSTILLLLTFAASAQKDSLRTITVTDASGNTKDSVGIFVKVEVEASYPGGLPAWRNYLMQNLNPDAPVKEVPKRVKHFEQTAIVQFIVCTDGSICDVKVVNDVLPSIKKEAERAILNSGKWEPAMMEDGRKVKAYRKQPITFVVDTK